jgi:hypothetical protein
MERRLSPKSPLHRCLDAIALVYLLFLENGIIKWHMFHGQGYTLVFLFAYGYLLGLPTIIGYFY